MRILGALIFLALLACQALAQVGFGTFDVASGSHSHTSISNGGGSVAVDGSGAVDVVVASGQDYTLTLAGGGIAIVTGGVIRSQVGYALGQSVTSAAAFGLAVNGSNARLAAASGGAVQIGNANNGTRFNVTGASNAGLGTTAPGGSGTAGTNTLSIAIGTEPVTAQAGQIHMYAKDSSDGSTNATLAFLTEQAVESVGTFTASHKIKVWINGTEYWLQLDAI